MFCSPVRTQTAKVKHKCSSCGEPIEAGDRYLKWASFDDGGAATNKMHPECYEAHSESAAYWGDSQWEYKLYGHNRGSSE